MKGNNIEGEVIIFDIPLNIKNGKELGYNDSRTAATEESTIGTVDESGAEEEGEEGEICKEFFDKYREDIGLDCFLEQQKCIKEVNNNPYPNKNSISNAIHNCDEEEKNCNKKFDQTKDECIKQGNTDLIEQYEVKGGPDNNDKTSFSQNQLELIEEAAKESDIDACDKLVNSGENAQLFYLDQKEEAERQCIKKRTEIKQPKNSTDKPTLSPIEAPIEAPTELPTAKPTPVPTVSPTGPTANPTNSPTDGERFPTVAPTSSPTSGPTSSPTESHSRIVSEFLDNLQIDSQVNTDNLPDDPTKGLGGNKANLRGIRSDQTNSGPKAGFVSKLGAHNLDFGSQGALDGGLEVAQRVQSAILVSGAVLGLAFCYKKGFCQQIKKGVTHNNSPQVY